jgi:hypothetical protein
VAVRLLEGDPVPVIDLAEEIEAHLGDGREHCGVAVVGALLTVAALRLGTWLAEDGDLLIGRVAG